MGRFCGFGKPQGCGKKWFIWTSKLLTPSQTQTHNSLCSRLCRQACLSHCNLDSNTVWHWLCIMHAAPSFPNPPRISPQAMVLVACRISLLFFETNIIVYKTHVFNVSSQWNTVSTCEVPLPVFSSQFLSMNAANQLWFKHWGLKTQCWKKWGLTEISSSAPNI